MSAPAHATADTLRPIQVHSYLATPPGAKPRLPTKLVEMFWRELSTEPHMADEGRWTREQADLELRRLMAQGGVAIAWKLGQPSVPIALAVCEEERSDQVTARINFPMSGLFNASGGLRRQDSILNCSYLILHDVACARRALVAEKLVMDAARSFMSSLRMTQAVVLLERCRPSNEAFELCGFRLGAR